MKQITNIGSVISADKYYVISAFGRLGFITREDYEIGNFIPRCFSYLTQGNNWDYRDSSLAGLINQMLRAKNYEIFEFDTQQEMFAFLYNPKQKKESKALTEARVREIVREEHQARYGMED